MTLAEDIAATQTIPGCRGVLDLMDRIEEIHKTDPYEARRLYFKWKTLSKAVAENPEIWVSPGVEYGDEMPRRSGHSPGPERPAKEAARV